ncbi:MAG: helix-turn-helix domain-containing protein [Leptolyngbyaceae cyanobacterium MO_188.B28]|nr:helix-turn-helix domain-containing protein [Leptolyngbyaceae cyanobacterium MO_188.B28]
MIIYSRGYSIPYTYDASSNIVDVYVGHLRKKIDSHLIETVRVVGYRLQNQATDLSTE